MSMSPADAFRRRAQECKETAALLSGEPERELWLQIAAEYAQMAEEAGNVVPQLSQQSQAPLADLAS
jgi:hypothetical protein